VNGKDWESLQVNIREYFERVIKELDTRYIDKFSAAEKAVNAALAAQDKMTAAAFASGEKAVSKAEEAQKDYNVRSNEFRGQLEDQAKRLIPRTEVTGLLNNVEVRIESLDKAVAELREDRSRAGGRSAVSMPLIIALLAPICAIIGAVLMWMLSRGGGTP